MNGWQEKLAWILGIMGSIVFIIVMILLVILLSRRVSSGAMDNTFVDAKAGSFIDVKAERAKEKIHLAKKLYNQ
jgi:hypothetical protein